MSYKLYLDDYRDAPEGWILVKNYLEFKQCILENGIPEIVSFDHDLADFHYDHGLSGDRIPYENMRGEREYTGYHCALWLLDHCKENNLKFPAWNVHSMNPVGRQNIINLLSDRRLSSLLNRNE